MTLKTFILSFILFCATAVLAAKPRLIVTTDIGGDPDDSQSMVRLLVYANEFDIEGLIASASGTPGELDEAVTRPDLIEERVRAYGLVLPNLLKHDADYPGMDYLLQRIKSGNKFRGMDYIGANHDTEGSNHIITVVDKADKRPVNIAIWGGQTDLAQALWRVRHDRTAEQLAAFVGKIRVYDIADQDGLFDWIHSNFPDVWYILNKALEGVDKREAVFRGMYLGGDESLTSRDWLRAHITRNHGPLGEAYPDSGLWTDPNPYGALKEGDTPSWFYFLPNGLSETTRPDFGGWGGRFHAVEKTLYNDANDELNGVKSARVSVWRWRTDFQHDFAARLDWCVKDVADANHCPVANVNGDNSTNVLVIKSTPGQTVELDASASFDPDGDALSYMWWIYKDISSYPGQVVINNATAKKASIDIPVDFSTHVVHIICQVTDDGDPTLTSYRRVVLVGDKYDYYIKKTLNDIKIDGLPEEEWSKTRDSKIVKPAGIEAPLMDLSGTWKALWDDDNLYLYVDIVDGAPTLRKSAGLEHDAIHLYINSDRDVLNPKTNFFYEVSKLSSVIFERENDALTGVEFKTSIYEAGFALELKIPWTTLKKEVANDKFDLEIRALDYPDRNAALPEAAIAWAFAGAQNPFETGNLGTAFLGGLEPTENSAPHATIESPKNGDTFLYGQPIDIKVDPFDADGIITYVDFYAEWGYLGRDRNDLDGWKLTWVDAPVGNHDLYVQAFDDSGAEVQSDISRIVVFDTNAETVLMVTGEKLTPTEIAIKQRFEQHHGYRVVCLDDDSVSTEAADGCVLIYLAESIGRNTMSDVFTQSICPIICADPYLLADLKMTGSRVNTDFGITRSEIDSLSILWPDHELAADLTGTFPVFFQPTQMVWGKPTDAAQIIAGVPNNADQSLLFAYERRDPMVDLSAPSTRVGFFLTSDSDAPMNDNGWALFDAAVTWAIEKHITHVDDGASPIEHLLISNYPNPFNPATIFTVDLPNTNQTTITIFDLCGRQVKTLTQHLLTAGRHDFVWDATNQIGEKVSSGVYLVRFQIGNDTLFKKITFLK